MKQQPSPKDIAAMQDMMTTMVAWVKPYLLATLVAWAVMFLSGGLTIWLGNPGVPLTLAGWLAAACLAALIANDKVGKVVALKIRRVQ